MPYLKKTVIRFWCPLGDECGKKNSYLNDAENREAAEQQLEQHLRSKPAHIDAGHDEQSIRDAISVATYEEIEKESYTKSPPRSTKGDRDDGRGEKAAGKGSRAIGKGNDSSRERSRSRAKRERLMEDMNTELLALRQQVARQNTSTTMKKHSSSGAVPTDRIGGESGMHILTENAGSRSSIVSSSQLITVERKTFEDAMEYIQLAETNCLDSSKLCAQASTAFNTQAYAINRLRQKLLYTLRRQV
jgi:hypothetical protein